MRKQLEAEVQCLTEELHGVPVGTARFADMDKWQAAALV